MKITNAIGFSNMTWKKLVGLWGNLYPFDLDSATHQFQEWIVHSILDNTSSGIFSTSSNLSSCEVD